MRATTSSDSAEHCGHLGKQFCRYCSCPRCLATVTHTHNCNKYFYTVFQKNVTTSLTIKRFWDFAWTWHSPFKCAQDNSPRSSAWMLQTTSCSAVVWSQSRRPSHSLTPWYRLKYGTMFNTLPDDLRDPAVSTSTFRQSLKTHLFSAYQHV